MITLGIRGALLIRTAIQAITQVGLIAFADQLFGPLIDFAKKELAEAYDLTPEEAEDTLANELIDALALVGIIGLSIRTKLPTIVAEKLGFTAKGYVKRKLSAKLPASAVGTATKGSKITTLAQPEAQAQIQTIVKRSGTNFDTVAKVANIVVATAGVPVGVGLLITNTIDFGAWNSSAYQRTFQDFLSIFGLEPDKDSRSPRTTSAEIFNKIYFALQGKGASEIKDPYKNTVVPFTRDNLLDLADKLAGQILIENGEVKAKTLLGAILPLIAFGSKPATGSGVTLPVFGDTQSGGSKVQVFTGIVSQGVLGTGTQFQARPNDMIDNTAELIDSARINLANFLASLPSRVIYEIKIVPTITTKDGFTQRGTSTRVQTGKYFNGTPRYKTVTNKFAVLNMYFFSDKGARVSLGKINIGPVNAVNFQVSQSDLQQVANSLQQVATTSNVADITKIVTDKPVTVETKTPVLAPLPNYNTSAKNEGDLGYAFYKRPGDKSNPPQYLYVPNYKFYDPTAVQVTEEEYRRATGDTSDFTNSGYSIVNGVFTQYKAIPVVTTYKGTTTPTATTSPPAQRAGANALTLSEWYSANGKSLPPVAERAVLYEQYGLGTSTLYIGSSEQNIRLLDKLKS